MWKLEKQDIEVNSDCDYSLKPVEWNTCPIVVVQNYFTTTEVNALLKVVESNKQHAICNLGYRRNSKANYMFKFRRSADLNECFFDATIWDRLESDMLLYAIEKYGAQYSHDKKAISGHSFCTIYQESSGVLNMHSDGGTLVNNVWKSSVTSRYEMTALVYLTTQGKDFTGGAISFPYLVDESGKMFTYNPVAGDALFFPANPIFAHQVSESVGKRILLGSWRYWRPYPVEK